MHDKNLQPLLNIRYTHLSTVSKAFWEEKDPNHRVVSECNVFLVHFRRNKTP